MSLILALILLNGFFASVQVAVVSAPRDRLHALAAGGHPGARRVLALQQHPGRFLSTVQIGITLVATLVSAVGGASVVRFLEPRLAALPLPWPAIYAEIAALLLVVVAISYLTLVLGDRVHKEVALRRTVSLAMRLSGLLDPTDWQVTHLILRNGRFWDHRTSTVSVLQVERVGGSPVPLQTQPNNVGVRDAFAFPSKV